MANWMHTRQTKFTLYVVVYTAVVLAILVGVNFLANRYNKTFDATANKRFTLSEQTEKVVKGLKQDVKLTYFDRTDRFNAAKETLERYDNLSTRLKVEYIDPDKKPMIARAAGISQTGMTIVESGQRREEAKSVTEEEITGALIRVLKGGARTVCFVSGSGERSLEESKGSGYSVLKTEIEKNNYKTKTISLIGRAEDAATPPAAVPATPVVPGGPVKVEIPKDCTVTVVGGPRFDYTQPAVDAIKAHVEGGGRMLLMLDPPLRFGKDDIAPNAALKTLVQAWGVELADNLVLDLSGVGQLVGLSEVVPLVTRYTSSPIVRDFRDVATAFPLTRSMETKTGEKSTVEGLFASSKNSFATTSLATAEIRPDPAKDKRGPLTLAAAITYRSDTGQGRVVVTGSSGWVANNIVMFNGNKDLALNMLNWLSSDEDLISIRPKDPEDRRLSMTRSQLMTVVAISQVLIPLSVIVAGVFVWWRRR